MYNIQNSNVVAMLHICIYICNVNNIYIDI